MPSALDVASYILAKQSPMTAMKLQKLVYYCQAWSLVWDERSMFDEPIEAWANGPVVPALFAAHKGTYVVFEGTIEGDPARLDPESKETIDVVLQFYGDKPSHWLSELTHSEAPWVNARNGLEPGERGHQEITHAAMHEYYDGLDPF